MRILQSIVILVILGLSHSGAAESNRENRLKSIQSNCVSHYQRINEVLENGCEALGFQKRSDNEILSICSCLTRNLKTHVEKRGDRMLSEREMYTAKLPDKSITCRFLQNPAQAPSEEKYPELLWSLHIEEGCKQNPNLIVKP